MRGFNLNMADFFCQALDVAMVMDTSGAQVGIKGEDGYIFLKPKQVEGKTGYTLTKGLGGKLLPAAGIFTLVKDLKVGDIILNNGRAAGFFIGFTEGKGELTNSIVRILTKEGKIRAIVLPESTFGMGPGLLAVRTANGVNPMMLAMLNMSDDNDSDMGDIIELMMMNQMMGGNGNLPNIFNVTEGNMQELLPFMFLKGKDKGIGKFLMLQNLFTAKK